MKIFSSRILFPPLSTFCLCVLVLELSGKCRASETLNLNPNATSRAFTHHGAGHNNKKVVWRNPTPVKRDSGYGDASGQYNSNSNSAAIAAVLNSDGNSAGAQQQQQQQSSSFDSYASSGYDNEGKAMGSNYADSYGVPSPSSSYGMSDYGHMMHEPSSMKYHYKVIPHQETSGMGWGNEEDDGDSGLKEIVGTILGIKGVKGLKGLKGLGLLSLPLLPILIPLVLAIPLLPLIAIAGLLFFFPIPIITMPTRIGTAGTAAAGTNPISQVFPALFPVNIGGRTSQELWNASNLNESEQFLSRAASRVLNEENYYYSHFDYIRNMVKAVAQEIYTSSTRSTRGRDLKDSDKNQSQNKKNQCLERMACELTQFLRKISPKSSSFISGTMKKFLGSGDNNSISRQIRTGISSSPIEISGSGNGSEVKVKSCKERFSCERLKEASPQTDQSNLKTTTVVQD